MINQDNTLLREAIASGQVSAAQIEAHCAAGELGATQMPPLPVVDSRAWQAGDMPQVPMQWVEVYEVNLYRFLPYKPNSTEFKRGKKGRWQRHTGYGFDNAEPQAGPWRIAQGGADAEQQAA